MRYVWFSLAFSFFELVVSLIPYDWMPLPARIGVVFGLFTFVIICVIMAFIDRKKEKTKSEEFAELIDGWREQVEQRLNTEKGNDPSSEKWKTLEPIQGMVREIGMGLKKLYDPVTPSSSKKEQSKEPPVRELGENKPSKEKTEFDLALEYIKKTKISINKKYGSSSNYSALTDYFGWCMKFANGLGCFFDIELTQKIYGELHSFYKSLVAEREGKSISEQITLLYKRVDSYLDHDLPNSIHPKNVSKDAKPYDIKHYEI